VRRIVGFLEPAPGDLFLELGAGRGALSGALAAGPVELVAIELDHDCLPELEAVLAPYPGARVLQGDALKLDLGDLLASHRSEAGRLRAVGNLPYNVATALIQRTLDPGLRLTDLTFLVQLEMADRITARPGTAAYGYFSVFCQHRADSRIVFKVPPGAFQPRPKVTSALVALRPRADESEPATDLSALDRVTRAAFAHRRKTIANSMRLASLLEGSPEPLLERAGIAATRRAEEVSVQEYRRLARHYREESGDSHPCYTRPRDDRSR
jgi:16S rRNA (adenine1518-N6/adenine1519-N6)-dimethyltransferase